MKIGFLGAGSIGSALVHGLIKSNPAIFDEIWACDVSEKARQKLRDMGANVATDACELCQTVDMVVIALKPQMLKKAIEPCLNYLGGKFVVSIAAGWPVDRLKELLPTDAHLLRVMPNTPALVGCGMTVLCNAPELTSDERTAAETLFGSVGKFIWLDETYIDAVTGLSGSGPAYAYMFIEAMADGGVRMGLPRDVALTLAAETVSGAAQMVIQTGMHPGALKDAVCSPAGTTIEAVRMLEQRSMRSVVMEAVICCSEKSHEMSQAQKSNK